MSEKENTAATEDFAKSMSKWISEIKKTAYSKGYAVGYEDGKRSVEIIIQNDGIMNCEF